MLLNAPKTMKKFFQLIAIFVNFLRFCVKFSDIYVRIDVIH